MTHPTRRLALLAVTASCLAGCGGPQTTTYHDPAMDFGAIEKVAVLPFASTTRDAAGPERVRDAFATMLLATGAFYVIPRGEVGRGLTTAAVRDPSAPTTEQIVQLGQKLGVDAIFVGVLREYGQVRSGQSNANVISLSVQLLETQTGRVVWTGATTRGGVGFWTRLIGGGGEPMNVVTEQAVGDLLDSLFGPRASGSSRARATPTNASDDRAQSPAAPRTRPARDAPAAPPSKAKPTGAKPVAGTAAEDDGEDDGEDDDEDDGEDDGEDDDEDDGEAEGEADGEARRDVPHDARATHAENAGNDPELIRKALAAYSRHIGRCTTAELARRGTDRGKGNLFFTVDRKGRVTQLHFREDHGGAGGRLEQCLQVAARGWRFPRASDTPYDVNVPVVMRGQGR